MSYEEKPWGSEEILELNTDYMVKRLCLNKGHRSSLHYHKLKAETFIVLSGTVDIFLYTNKSCRIYTIERLDNQNSILTLKPNQIHRIIPVTDTVLYEASTPHPNDTWRLKDDYKRD